MRILSTKNSFYFRAGLLVFGVAFLIYGTVGYIVFRASSKVYFLQFFDLPEILPPLPSLMIWNNHLPSLIHVVAFSFFTLAILNTTFSKWFYIPFLWALMNILFEISQHSVMKGFFSNVAQHELLPRFITNYSLRGTFDWNDIFYSLIGAGMVVLLVMLLAPHSENIENNIRQHP